MTKREQTPLDFSRPYVPSNGTATSDAAAASKRPSAGTDEARVYALIVEYRDVGRTDDEIEHVLDMLHQNASARRRGLVLRGLIADSGQRRKTRSGRAAIVWRAK